MDLVLLRLLRRSVGDGVRDLLVLRELQRLGVEHVVEIVVEEELRLARLLLFCPFGAIFLNVLTAIALKIEQVPKHMIRIFGSPQLVVYHTETLGIIQIVYRNLE